MGAEHTIRGLPPFHRTPAGGWAREAGGVDAARGHERGGGSIRSCAGAAQLQSVSRLNSSLWYAAAIFTGPALSLLVCNCSEGGCSGDWPLQEVLARASSGGGLEALWGPTLVHLDDLPWGGDLAAMPDSFTQFRKKVSNLLTARSSAPTFALSLTDAWPCLANMALAKADQNLSKQEILATPPVKPLLHLETSQVEEGPVWRVRPELPAPAWGQLPLPSGGLPALPSAFAPVCVKDLGEFAQQHDGPALLSPEHCSKVGPWLLQQHEFSHRKPPSGWRPFISRAIYVHVQQSAFGPCALSLLARD